VLAGTLILIGVSSPAIALSADAQRIVDRVTATTQKLRPVCSDRAKLTTVVTDVTIALAKAKQIATDPPTARAAGMEAGRYLYFHCPSS
jgi:hypothetical protein